MLTLSVPLMQFNTKNTPTISAAKVAGAPRQYALMSSSILGRFPLKGRVAIAHN